MKSITMRIKKQQKQELSVFAIHYKLYKKIIKKLKKLAKNG